MRGLSTGARAGTALAAALVLVAGATTTMAATASGAASSDTLPGAFGSVPPQTGTPTNGGVVTIAESPGAGPTYIFPIYPAADASIGTNQQFQQYMWRSLWWSPKGASPTIDYGQSIAGPPVYTNGNKTVTVHLYPGWKWSDGTPITSQDLAFDYWVLEGAVNKTVGGSPANYGDYTPGLYPDNVTSVATPNPRTFVINFNKGYNQNFIFLEELGVLEAAARARLGQDQPHRAHHPVQQPEERRCHLQVPQCPVGQVVDLRVQPPVAGGGRPVQDQVLRPGHRRQHPGGQPCLHRTGQAPPGRH